MQSSSLVSRLLEQGRQAPLLRFAVLRLTAPSDADGDVAEQRVCRM